MRGTRSNTSLTLTVSGGAGVGAHGHVVDSHVVKDVLSAAHLGQHCGAGQAERRHECQGNAQELEEVGDDGFTNYHNL